MLFGSKEHIKMWGSTEPFFELVTFLSAKGEHKSHHSKNALKTVVDLHKQLYIQ